MGSFTLKKTDRKPPLKAQLLDSADAAIDLTGATVVFRMMLKGATSLKVNASATVTDALNGKVEYAWGASDTDTAGLYLGEFEITFADGTKQVVPNDEYTVIEIVEVLP